jgi:S1-C subfamily serine protease
VFIEHVDKTGSGTVSGSGFFVSPNTVVTSFNVIDGAESLRLALGDKTFTVEGVVARNRFQDWAVLRTAERSSDVLTLADAKSGEVGERCVAMSVAGQGNRSLADGVIGGILTKANIGDRLALSMDRLSADFDAMKDVTSGSPLMNLRGQVFAIAVGPSTVLPGSGWVGLVRSHNLFESDSPFAGLKVLGVPAKYFSRALTNTPP